MRVQLAAINSGMGRRVALICAICATALLTLMTGIVARDDLRHDREQDHHLMQSTATQAARSVASRLDAAETVLRAAADSVREGLMPRSGLRRQLTQTGPFGWGAIVEPSSSGQISNAQRQLQLTPEQQLALENGRSVILSGESPAGLRIYLARRVFESLESRVLIGEVAPEWLWTPLEQQGADFRVLAIDARGGAYSSTLEHVDEIRGLFADRLGSTADSATLAWQTGGQAWTGVLAAVPASSAAMSQPLGIVVAQTDIAWPSYLKAAVLKLLPVILFTALLVVLAAVLVAQRYVPPLRQLRRALLQLADSKATMPRPPKELDELRQVIDAFNRTAERIDRQRTTLHALTEIDALLIGAAELENVLDRVLERVRDVTLARNVGITLIDANAPGYGRLFSVSAEGGCPISRVSLDPQMAQTLLESRSGLTIVRCEEVRHSFLAPLQASGAQFFWVWPVIVGERVAAILSVGYAEPPQLGGQVAHYGTECARRLAASLATNARSEQLYRQAHFDPLTQLPNRLLFRDRLEQELSGLGDSATRGALLYIDLDHFKRVNDTLGHDAGDQLLAIVAQRLRSCVKDGDTVARLGGDEFTVILRQVVESAAVAAVADRIIQSLQMPVSIGGKDHQVRASIGITLFPDDGAALDDLMRNADLAMYRAKDMGRGAAVFYEPKMAARGTRVADSGLYRALKRREFSLFYQPQYSVRDGSLLGVEALLRWQTPRDGMRSPSEFIPAAEESGLIIDLGGWVLEAACQQLSQWRGDGLEAPPVSVNISVQQLRDPGFAATVRRLLDRYQIPLHLISLELTESALSDPDSQMTVEALAEMDVGLILDDFGTGHTALNNLRRYPVRAVKIDSSFIEGVAESAAAAAMAGTIIVMAHALDKQVVAEGVETLEQLDFLRERGCDVAQGYYLARPLPVATMTEMLMREVAENAGTGQAASA
jgi:diguanylate cyclase (GGDEF)-like protein